MTSKAQPAADYWTDDRENLGTRLCYFWWAEKQRAKWRNSFENGEIFWMNNKAVNEFGFRRICRILQISEGVIHLSLRPLWITPPLICWILHILLSLIQWFMKTRLKDWYRSLSGRHFSKGDDIKIKRVVSPFFLPLPLYLAFTAVLSLFLARFHGLEVALELRELKVKKEF